MSFRKETWLRLTRQTETVSVHIVTIGVSDGQVPVNQASLESLFSSVPSNGDTSNPWTITYELMAELLGDRGYRKWDTDE